MTTGAFDMRPLIVDKEIHGPRVGVFLLIAEPAALNLARRSDDHRVMGNTIGRQKGGDIVLSDGGGGFWCWQHGANFVETRRKVNAIA